MMIFPAKQIDRAGAIFQFVDIDDFDSVLTTAGSPVIPNGTLCGKRPWRVGLIAGATFNAVTTGQDATHRGVVELAYANAANATSGAVGSGVSTFTFAAGQKWARDWLIRIPTLATGGDDYVMRLGYYDSLTTPTNGLYIEYNRGTSVNWRYISMAATVATPATAGTNVPVAAGAWIHLREEWDGAAFQLLADGVSIGSMAALPGAAPLQIGILRIAGVARSFLLDLYQESLQWNPARAT